MHILIGSNTPNDKRLGVSRIKHHIGSEFSRAGHSVDYLYADDVPRVIPWGRLPALNYSLAALRVVRTRERLSGPYDIINIHGGDGCLYGLYKRLYGRPSRYVVTLHGSEELYWNQWRQEERLGRAPKTSLKTRLGFHVLRLTQIRLALRTSDRVLCASFEGDKDFVVSRYKIDPCRATVVPNGVSEEYFVERRYDAEVPRLLMVGTWIWRKGIHYLVRAFEQLHTAHPDVRLSLVGTMAAPDEVKSAFPESLRQWVRVQPSLPNDQILQEYQQHDVFVLPSLFEGMPLAMLEAMATGMPVVVSDACGMHDFIAPGHDGLLVPRRDAESLAQALDQLVCDRTLRERVGTNAQAKMRAYTWEKVARLWWTAMTGNCTSTAGAGR